jgi:hypothetical protein
MTAGAIVFANGSSFLIAQPFDRQSSVPGAETEAIAPTETTSTFDCVGDGGYAGLSAILVLEDAGGNAEDIVGLIFSGDFPPLPEPPADE